MKQKTLQEQYNSINEGKGSKDMLLRAAKQLFPNLIPNHFNYDQTIPLLKQKGIIYESIGGLVTKGKNPDWFSIFNENLTEADAKAIEKKSTKDVTDKETEGYDFKNKELIDNIYGQAFLVGYYAELKDPKNNDKTVDELKAIVAKHLTTDPLYYVKNGQFGVKGLGYSDKLPGLTPSKTDQMVPVPNQPKYKPSLDTLGDKEKKKGMPKKVGEMSMAPKSSKGVQKMATPGKPKKVKLDELKAVAGGVVGKGEPEEQVNEMEDIPGIPGSEYDLDNDVFDKKNRAINRQEHDPNADSYPEYTINTISKEIRNADTWLELKEIEDSIKEMIFKNTDEEMDDIYNVLLDKIQHRYQEFLNESKILNSLITKILKEELEQSGDYETMSRDFLNTLDQEEVNQEEQKRTELINLLGQERFDTEYNVLLGTMGSSKQVINNMYDTYFSGDEIGEDMGSIELKKTSPDSDIKKYTEKGFNVKLSDK